MEFRIADTFTDSLARLTVDEQKAVKTTAFDLQLNPANPGMSFHKLDRAKDRRFWSVRAGSDLRLIVHRSEGSLLLCYVGHHDKAYAWAERRKLETHPVTGAAQIVELRELVRDVIVERPVVVETLVERVIEVERRVERGVEIAVTKAPLFAHLNDGQLLACGVPPDWLSDARTVGYDELGRLADHLPKEAAEALFQIAAGGEPPPFGGEPAAPSADPFAHPDAQRRFRLMTNVEELTRALDAPWDKWTIFLHPAQRQIAEGEYAGPARVAGSAGTGKTIVALHRAVVLARRDEGARVLLTTFSDPLAQHLRVRLRRLLAGEPRLAERLEVESIDAIGRRLFQPHAGKLRVATTEEVSALVRAAASESADKKLGARFLATEWSDVVDAWQLETWEAYRDVRRLGRRTRLSEAQRRALWSIFERVRALLDERGLLTTAGLFHRLAKIVGAQRTPPFQYAVVDEAQDLGVPHLRFLAALGGGRKNGLFFAGDSGQRIFQQPFSWKALGVEVRGRSRTLQVNYRTSHQIRTQADRLLGARVSDGDGNPEERDRTISVFDGPPPTVRVVESEAAEASAVAAWVRAHVAAGVRPEEVGLFVRSAGELPRARAALAEAGLPLHVLDDGGDAPPGHVAVGTMHLAKGLEFRSVIVMACDDEVVPLQSRIAAVADEADLEDVYATERHLLYVACTRARDHLLLTATAPGSEFLADLRGEAPQAASRPG